MHRWQMLAVLCFSAVSLGSGGCGSGSGGTKARPEDKFLGLWQLDGTMTSFSLVCPQAFGTAAQSFSIWQSLDMQRGVLTGISEVSTACLQPGLSFDVDTSGNILQLVNPDPYTTKAPLCETLITNDPTTGNPLVASLTFTSASFTLLQPISGQPPRGLLTGTASGPLVNFDPINGPTQTDTCTYTGSGDTFHHMTQL